jgi:hypothetical protein
MQPDELSRLRTVEQMQQQIQQVRQTAAVAAGTATGTSLQWEQSKVDRLRAMVLREPSSPQPSSVAPPFERAAVHAAPQCRVRQSFLVPIHRCKVTQPCRRTEADQCLFPLLRAELHRLRNFFHV